MPAKVYTHLVRLVAVLALLVSSCLASAGAATAGGPTSAILVAPQFQRAAAIYYSDPEYQQLDTLLAEPATNSADPNALPADGSSYITVTWLIHDVSIWRIDRIFPTGEGDYLIVTQPIDGRGVTADGMNPGKSGSDTAVTHRSADPEALGTLLERLGLTAGVQRAPTDVAVAAVSDPTMMATSTAGPTSAAVTAWWMLAGLVLGAGATALTIRFLPVVRRRMVRESGAVADQPVRMIRLSG